MLNSQKNAAQLDNPKYLELSDKLTDKYAEKQAYEESDITTWTRLLYLLPHLLIAGGTIGLVQFLEISRFERIFYTVLVSGLALSLEWFKGVYMERYFVANLKTNDVEQPRDVRQVNQRKKGVNFKILLVFWGISATIFCVSGSLLAKKTFGNAEKLNYDTNIENALVVAMSTLDKATKESAGSGTLKNLSAKVENARNAWTSHKKEIDSKNNSLKSYHDDDIFNYSVFAFIICLLLEIGLFAARGFHETKQYEIHKSLNGIASPTPTTTSGTGNTSEIEKLKAKIRELQEQLKQKDETIAFYKEKNNILLAETRLNGHHSKS